MEEEKKKTEKKERLCIHFSDSLFNLVNKFEILETEPS